MKFGEDERWDEVGLLVGWDEWLGMKHQVGQPNLTAGRPPHLAIIPVHPSPSKQLPLSSQTILSLQQPSHTNSDHSCYTRG